MGNWEDRAGRTVAAARRVAERAARQAAQRTAPARASALRSVRGAGQQYAHASTRWVVGVAAGSGLVLAVVSIAAAGPWQGGQRMSERALAAAQPVTGAAHPGRTGAPTPGAPAWHDAADVLLPAGGTGTPPTGSGLGSVLAGPMGDSALGQVTASVVDVSDGRVLYSARADQALMPASTNKIATATAALDLLGPEHYFTTTVVGSATTGLTLVGGGDPTLTASSGSDSLSALAAETAAALRSSAAGSSPGTGTGPSTTGGGRRIQLHYDISLFSPPALHPIGVNGNIALVQALTADEGRVDPASTEDAPRYPDPAAHAASVFAADLAGDGVDVDTSPSQAAAEPHAPLVAQVRSAPLGDIVERMLTDSDNDIAEALGHACAIAAGEPATFAGGAEAVKATLTRLGIRLGATHLVDSSGLSREDGIPAAVLTQLLVLDASPSHPGLRSILSGLPIAGFTGTLDNRYGGDGSEAGLGVVRAKTGSLSTVNTLAGLVVDRSGRLLAFAFMSNGSGSADSARSSLDRLAAKVATCGCD